MIHMETDRFILRDIEHHDANGMFELDSDTEVHRYLGGNAVKNIDEIPAIIDFIRQQYQQYGIGRWAVVDKHNDEFVGWCGLKFITDTIHGQQNFYELGYRFIKRYWGLGIATETAHACKTYAFEKMNVNELFAMADSDNQGSHHVLSKIGFEFLESFDLDGVMHNWYRADNK